MAKLITSVPAWLWTALIAVVTSVVSTVVVEYAAKPRLEARKARLLYNRQHLDGVIFGLQTLALYIGSLVTPVNGKSPELFDIYTMQLHAIQKASADARSTIGRLSHRYAERHRRHLQRTMYFLAYVETTATAVIKDFPGADARLRATGELIEHFDTYFLVYLGVEDSAEPLLKRIFWRIATRKQYEAKSEDVSIRLGAPPTA